MIKHFRRFRHPSAFHLVVKTPSGSCSATVVDISAGGAQLKNVTGVLHGDKLTLQVLDISLTGFVRWTRGDKVGIAFTVPPTPELLDALRKGARQIAN
ncbi:PilZ domain-containing protein [Loktanella sp. M215]|uniref:PilZ domain-containing protein n=1 Tax=Loktanella sp. M215 TaxID=2675431 RepID=UPI001F2331A9|nr:PilZ domain-containing protein [Loktanella sp. M215]MCF7699063.1 hypothetical protein [Loktanella sp. M215]